MNKDAKIIITGAAGLLGQNTILLLQEQGYYNIVAIDKHHDNLKVLRMLNSKIEIIEADLSESGDWSTAFKDASVLIQLHAQITSLFEDEYIKNNIVATTKVLDSVKMFQVPFIVHISSSVVDSVADDYYTRTKMAQEQLVSECGVAYCTLRPTLMFGWFDKKHLGWLSRFMKKTPVFPIPGNGKFLRQPLYARDMAKVIITAMEKQPQGIAYNIIGREDINYIDIIKKIKKVKNYNTLIMPLPYNFFKFLMKLYALIFKNPPFTADQLEALTAGDYFKVDPWWDTFSIEPTRFEDALVETFMDTRYSKITLKP